MNSIGAISKRQMQCGQRMRKVFELSLGLSSSAIARLGDIPGGGSNDGPSEARMVNLAKFAACRDAVGLLIDVIEPVVLRGMTIKEYAERYRLNRAAVSARLIAGLDILIGYYDRVDAKARTAAHG